MVTVTMKLKDSWSLEGKLGQTCRCCCWVASVVPDSVRPHRRQPTRLPAPGILQARTLGWVAIAFSRTNLDRVLKSRDITLPTKIHLVRAVVFPVVLYGCESWTIKKVEHWKTDVFGLWCWRRGSPLDCKEIKPVNPKGNQPWTYIGRTDAEGEAPLLWPPDVKSQLIGKDPDAGKDWRQEEKGTAEDEMVGWHHQFNGHEFEHAPGNDDGQGGLACCSPLGYRKLDVTK